jgi:DNA-binding HxlR family transcriptional regulator
VTVTAPRTYGERCAAAHALDLVGERWALLVVRELLLGPKRFTDLRAGIPNASPNVLAQRLRELEDGGVVRRRKLPPPAASQVYELTDWGQMLEDVIIALGRFGSRSPSTERGADMSVDSHVLAMKTLFDPRTAGDLDATFGLRLGDETFRATVTGGRLELERGDAYDADAILITNPETLLGLLWEGLKPADAQRAGDAEVAGDKRLLARFLRLFPRPVAVAG